LEKSVSSLNVFSATVSPWLWFISARSSVSALFCVFGDVKDTKANEGLTRIAAVAEEDDQHGLVAREMDVPAQGRRDLADLGHRRDLLLLLLGGS
jgi:hypothetical protein